MINKNQISEKLSTYAISQMAKEEKFAIRSDGKIKAVDFIQSFFLMIQNGSNTLKAWAETLSFLMDSETTLSDSAIHQRLQFKQVDFFKSLLSKILNHQIIEQAPKRLTTRLLEPFNRVFLEDSTCLNLPINLADIFKGAHSKSEAGKAATARIQFRTDIKQGTASHIVLQSYRDNDQKFSGDILEQLQANDLVIRDMGYWSLKVFRKIYKSGAYLLTRYLPNTHLFQADGKQEQINLIELTRKADKQGKTVIDQQVLVGKEEQLSSRLVMIKVPEKVAAERRRKAKKNRNKRVNYTKEYMELLGWSIYITNVDESIWQAEDVFKVYGYRWRIENIFKCWKTHFNFQNLFAGKQSLTLPRVIITIYLLLIWIMLFFNRLYIYFERAIFEKKKEFISLMKFASFINRWFIQLSNTTDLDQFIDKVYYYCKYDKRKKGENFSQSIYYKNLA